MAKFAQRVSAAFEMARAVGLRSTFDRVRLFARGRIEQRRRARQFRRLNLNGPVVREIVGHRMKLDPARPGLDRDLILNGIREPVATGHLMRLLRTDDILLDIGANIGYYTLIASRLCKKVYACEPHPENMERLTNNIELNNYVNIETFQVGFGANDDELQLACSELSNWHSCKGVAAGGPGVIEVPGARIDSFVADKIAPTIVKMDVEGYELEVLRGARNTLRHVRGVFLELHGEVLSNTEIKEVIDSLADSGLSPTLIVQYDWPGLSRIYPLSQIDVIRSGDRGTYELFFERLDDTVEKEALARSILEVA
jgi:FkbM family methyltransferase